MPARKKKSQFLARAWPRPAYVVTLAATLILSPTLFESALRSVLNLFSRMRAVEARLDSFERDETNENAIQNARISAIEQRHPTTAADP
jgi:hypothetical protein